MSAVTRRSLATATIAGTSGPAHASTIRARRASAWAEVARRVHRSNTARSSSDSSNGSSFGPRRGTDAPAAEVTQLLTINYWRRTLAPEGTWVRYDGEGRPPVTDGPFAETKDLIAGWMVIDVDSYERAVELAGELSAAPGAGGKPIHEWLELRPFLAEPPTITE